MCGIVGYIGLREPKEVLLEGLKTLEYRGYDSAGIALKNDTSSLMGMYACRVFSDKDAVREAINNRIKILSNIKI